MNGFAQKVTDAISNLKSSPEYEPGKEVEILVPVENKSATLKGIPLDEEKISYIEGPRRINMIDGGYYELRRGQLICRVTGKVR